MTTKEYEPVSSSSTSEKLMPTTDAITEVGRDTENPIKTMDDFTHMRGYCFIILFFSEFILLLGAGNMLFMVYAGAAPKQVSCYSSNGTLVSDVCKTTDVSYRDLFNCSVEYEFVSVNVEFGHFCEETRLVKSSISTQMTGVLFGTLISGTLSDRFGRLKILMISYTATSIMCILVSFSTNLTTFTYSRTLLGLFTGGIVGTYGVYKMEHIPKKHRFWVATVIAWAPNLIMLNFIAYFCHDWRTFQRVVFYISSPAFILCMFICESPRWLIQRGKIDYARKVLAKIQYFDRRKANQEDIEQMLHIEYQRHLARAGKSKNYNVRHLFYNKQMTIATLTLCIGIFFTSVTTYGLTFNMERLAGSLFLNSFIMGALRWLLNIISAVLDYRVKCVGRKGIHFVSQATIAVSVGVVAVLILLGVEKEYSMPIRVAFIIAAATSSQIFIGKSILALEFYPTVIRNQAMAMKSVCSRVGTIVAPQTFFFSPWRAMPFVIYTVAATMDTFAFQLLLPETKGRPLPDRLPSKKNKRIEDLPIIDTNVTN